MTKENDAHSGANPEPTADLETDTSLAPAIDNTTDDDATREIIRPETISAPASEPDGDEDDECDEYIDPGYTVVYDRIKECMRARAQERRARGRCARGRCGCNRVEAVGTCSGRSHRHTSAP